jgi:hypothetical protein
MGRIKQRIAMNKETYSQSLSAIEVKKNRLLLQKAALKTKLKRRSGTARKSRTRTLIQIGGLVDLTPLLAVCNINLGEDLQFDYPDKAAVLLGILIELTNRLPSDITDEDFKKYKNIGLNMLKYRL